MLLRNDWSLEKGKKVEQSLNKKQKKANVTNQHKKIMTHSKILDTKKYFGE